MLKTLLILAVALASARTGAAQSPTPVQGNAILKGFTFRSGETLPELRIHYPPELGILEREIARVPKGRAVVLPLSPETRGHGTHTIAAIWKRYLEELLVASAR